MKTTKAEQIKAYNNLNKGYAITNIKKLYGNRSELKNVWAKTSLYELYDKPSQAKIESWNDILNTYEPKEIISVQGSAHSYSVFLTAKNGDLLHITRSNNYLIQEVQA